jgi:hypothetical protein
MKKSTKYILVGTAFFLCCFPFGVAAELMTDKSDDPSEGLV